LISFIIGLSFGVHFMGLLTIPAIGMIYYFKNTQKVTIKSFLLANVVSVAILLFIFKLLLPTTLAFFGNSEVFFVNQMGLPFNSGTLIAALVFVLFFYYSLKYTQRQKWINLNTGILCVLFVLVGFSSWLMIPIRANANTVINENSPADARSLLAYYNLEQYPETHLFYGPLFSDIYAGQDEIEPYVDDRPKYERDYKTGKYIIVNHWERAKINSNELRDQTSNEILLSQLIAKRLSVGVGDEVSAYFQNSQNQQLPNVRKFKIAGLFLSGFPDFDENFFLGDLRHIQRINKWKNEEIGAYEVFATDLKTAINISSSIYEKLPSDLDVIEITRQYATIFQWISLFDFNILIIIIVMIVVGVINMSTALLVLIFERSSMIGLFKSLGAGNLLIQKIFFYNGVTIMSQGLFWGNLIGVIFFLTQKYFGWIRLDPETYYVNIAPVYLDFWDVLLLNFGFLVVSSLLLWIPSMIISYISPARVLRFR